ncbi:MAG: glycine--tRNA ligase, partial [Phycisphaerales bacterium]|nr:glycine--tRNA ligase [Phycisphaerales bacterium]
LTAEDRATTVGPDTREPGTLTEPRMFNLMFETHCGAIRNDDAKAYLRPETAQGIFVNFHNVVDSSRVRVPFGIAQMGKSFRNEVTPRNFTFRSREFEQMELEFFIHPDEAQTWYDFWRNERYRWWQAIGLAGDNLILRDHDTAELAHYAKNGAGVCDVEYKFPFTDPGFGELEGVAHRSDYDLRQHAEHCGKGDKWRYLDQLTNERYFPHVIEPSAGADRGTLALICEAFTPDDSRASKVYMNFEPRVAPIKAGIFPLVKKDGMPEIGEKLYKELRRRHVVEFDVKQSIGKRYARMDEAGTPYCMTIDGDTASDQAVTVRERNTQSQERVALDKVAEFLDEKIGSLGERPACERPPHRAHPLRRAGRGRAQPELRPRGRPRTGTGHQTLLRAAHRALHAAGARRSPGRLRLRPRTTTDRPLPERSARDRGRCRR